MFKANKLSLNNEKTKYALFHKKSSKDDLPLKPPTLKIADNKMERKTAIKFLVMLDEKVRNKLAQSKLSEQKILDYCTTQKNLLKVLILHIFIYT